MNQRILVLTGAGISEPSGIPTFRTGADGLWENHKIEEVCTAQAIRDNPELIFNFYRKLHDQYKDTQPNAAHYALKRLADESGIPLTIWTQNVDELHEKAGSNKVVHMHGTLQVRDTRDNSLHLFNSIQEYQSWYRPNVVLFGEDVQLTPSQIIEGAKGCTLFLSIGTSDNVWPANAMHRVLPKDCHKIQFNLNKTMYTDHVYNEAYLGDASISLPQFVDNYLHNLSVASYSTIPL